MNVLEIYEGSDGDATKAMYAELDKLGPVGQVAVNLFRAQKCSSRAKVYRGRRFKNDAYDRKNWSMENLCKILRTHAEELGIVWGWKEDGAQEFHKWVLYADLPAGQVSFHAQDALSPERYAGEWDRTHQSAERIIRFVQDVLNHGYVKGEAEYVGLPAPASPAFTRNIPIEEMRVGDCVRAMTPLRTSKLGSDKIPRNAFVKGIIGKIVRLNYHGKDIAVMQSDIQEVWGYR